MSRIETVYTERNGFLVGKSAALADWRHRKEEREFEALCVRLRQRNYLRRPEVAAHRNAVRRDRRMQQHRATVHSCAQCEAQFCRLTIAGHAPTYCSPDCRLASRRDRRSKRESLTCACGRPMTGRRERCRTCAQRARRAAEAA